MNTPNLGPPGGSREDIIGILLLAAAAGGVGYVLGRSTLQQKNTQPPLPPHAVVASAPLKQIAAEARLQPPTALAHLRRLQDQGKVQKVETEAGPRYAILPFFRCEWIDPDRRIRETWQSAYAIDWRYPLVTRVPDARAQSFLVEWLDRAQARQLLPPIRSRYEPALNGRHQLLQILVYGSCARGDAGANSDLDILLYGDAPRTTMEALKDLAHEISLRTGRTPDVRIMDRQTWDTATATFRDAIYREAKTVFSNDVEATFLERPLTVRHA